MKKFVCLTLALLVVGGAAAWALEGQLIDITADTQTVLMTETELAQSVEDNFSRLDTMLPQVRRLGLTKIEEKSRMMRYAYILTYYQPDDDVLDLIEAMAASYDLRKVLQAYEFWLDTEQDPQMLCGICEKIPNFEGNHWAENAFNSLTEDRGGVLTYDEVVAYMEEGVTSEELQAANILSRSGKTTIHNILEEKDNKNWAEVADAASSVKVRSISAAEVEPMAAITAIRAKRDVKAVSSVNLATIEADIEALQETCDTLASEAVNAMPYFSPEIGEMPEFVASTGVSQMDYESLREAGYDDVEISNFASVCNAKNVTLEKVVTLYEEHGGSLFSVIDAIDEEVAAQ